MSCLCCVCVSVHGLCVCGCFHHPFDEKYGLLMNVLEVQFNTKFRY
uniref:Uncharacterized protein n=1 Tax=Rhizophora mucronata TaxID=61149 RepID=A0A2P2JXK0_RHIMU